MRSRIQRRRIQVSRYFEDAAAEHGELFGLSKPEVAALALRMAQDPDLLPLLRRMQKNAFTDELTGLPNRTIFQGYFDKQLAAVRRHELPVAFAVIDIDHFKRFNDTHGHLVGDAVLRGVASQLKNNVREADFVARWGGEELVVVLSGGDLDHALDRLQKQMCRMIIQHEGKNYQVGTSIGAAILTSHNIGNLSADDIFEIADSALYQAKDAGRGQMVPAKIPVAQAPVSAVNAPM